MAARIPGETLGAATEETNVLDENCPARRVLELIADKWAILIIYALRDRTLRSGELGQLVQGISAKMMVQTLRALERDGLVTGTTYPVVPPKVEYTLTPLGQTLLVPLNSLCAWAENHLPDVELARSQAIDLPL